MRERPERRIRRAKEVETQEGHYSEVGVETAGQGDSRASHTNLRVIPLLPGSRPRSRESILLNEDLAGSGRVSRRSAPFGSEIRAGRSPLQGRGWCEDTAPLCTHPRHPEAGRRWTVQPWTHLPGAVALGLRAAKGGGRAQQQGDPSHRPYLPAPAWLSGSRQPTSLCQLLAAQTAVALASS